MALKNIFDMVKADRYTADGCTEIKKAREADVEDRVYNIGEISQKTGLMKTANGWVKPKKGNAGSAKKDVSGADVINNKYYKNDVRTEEGEKKILSETKTEVLKSKVKDLEDLKAKNGGKLGPQGEKSLQLAKEEIAKRAETKSAAEKPKTEKKSAPKPSVQEYMKAKQDIKKFEDTFKKQNEEYEARQRMGERAAALSPLWGLKPNDYKNNPHYKKAAELVKAFESKGSTPAQDEAPRILTGDTKIRIRK